MDYFRGNLDSDEVSELARNTALFLLWLTCSVLYGAVTIYIPIEEQMSAYFLVTFMLSLTIVGFALGLNFDS